MLTDFDIAECLKVAAVITADINRAIIADFDI